MAHDLRLLAPMIAIAFCLAGSATAILVVHRVPTDDAPDASDAPDAPDAPAFPGVARTQDAAGCPAAPRGSELRSGG